MDYYGTHAVNVPPGTLYPKIKILQNTREKTDFHNILYRIFKRLRFQQMTGYFLKTKVEKRRCKSSCK